MNFHRLGLLNAKSSREILDGGLSNAEIPPILRIQDSEIDGNPSSWVFAQESLGHGNIFRDWVGG